MYSSPKCKKWYGKIYIGHRDRFLCRVFSKNDASVKFSSILLEVWIIANWLVCILLKSFLELIPVQFGAICICSWKGINNCTEYYININLWGKKVRPTTIFGAPFGEIVSTFRVIKKNWPLIIQTKWILNISQYLTEVKRAKKG